MKRTGECKFCHRPVMWLPLLSGTVRSFNPEEFDVDDVGEPSAWVGKRTPRWNPRSPCDG